MSADDLEDIPQQDWQGNGNTAQLDDSSLSFAHSAKIQQKNSKYPGKYLGINLLYPPK